MSAMSQPIFTYDMDVLYEYTLNLLGSIWPLLALTIGISLAAMIIGIIIRSFKQFMEDKL